MLLDNLVELGRGLRSVREFLRFQGRASLNTSLDLLSLLITAKMWELVIMLILYNIPSTYQYSLVVNAAEEVRGKLAADQILIWIINN